MNTQDSTTDQVEPGEKWEFDHSVTAVFDDMLSRSIPQYEVMRKACFDLACKFIRPNTPVIDLGCSRGEALAGLVDKYGAHNRFIGLEVSQPMIDAARARFKGLIECSVVDIKEHDLRLPGLPVHSASVILSILTIQFTPIEYRLRILRDIYKTLTPGGAFIFVEKVLGNTAEINDFQIEAYYRLKAEHGYSQDQIERKRLSLEGVLVPVTAAMNEQFLQAAGFRQIDCFWRWMNFAGWIAVKD
jgi:tRNA (cmo5U34)-methyltransferase